MDFIPKQTLENVSLVKITTLLWNHHDIRILVTEFTQLNIFPLLDNHNDLIFNTERNFRTEKWQTIEDQVREKMTKLTIPITLKEKMLGYIEAVGTQILKWMEYHLTYCRLDLDLPKAISWTTQATINKKKTAEALVRDASIDIITRYKLACIYCLEDYIPGLFNEIPESQKNFYYNATDPSRILQMELVVFWGYNIKAEVSKIDDMIRRKYNHMCLYACLLRSAAESGNKTATEYFIQKLNTIEKPLISVSTALCVANARSNCFLRITNPPKEYYSEVLCFLLSQMNKEQQIEVFKSYPRAVLRCFLDWPLQSFFVELVNHLQNLREGAFSKLHDLFMIITYKMYLGCKDYNYKKVFQDVWQQTPDADKRCIINDDCITSLLEMLLLAQEKTNFKLVQLVFQDATVIDKSKIIFSCGGQRLFKSLIDHGKLDLLKCFVQLFISSKDEMIKFKEEFETFVQADSMVVVLLVGEMPANKYEKYSSVLDDFIQEYDKRRNMNETYTSSAKRFCNTEYKILMHNVKK